MNRNVIVGCVMLVLLMLLTAWNWGWFESEPEVVAEIRALAAQPQSEEKDRAIRDAMRARFEGVPEDQRMKMFEQLAPVFIPMMMARFESEYDKFIAMSPEERNRELDRRIDEMQKRGGPRGMGGQGGGPGGGGRPNVDPKQIDAFQKKMLAWTTPEQRAKMDNGMQMFRQRMEQRGMSPPPMPGGGFF